jgi:hypothetical protein
VPASSSALAGVLPSTIHRPSTPQTPRRKPKACKTPTLSPALGGRSTNALHRKPPDRNLPSCGTATIRCGNKTRSQNDRDRGTAPRWSPCAASYAPAEIAADLVLAQQWPRPPRERGSGLAPYRTVGSTETTHALEGRRSKFRADWQTHLPPLLTRCSGTLPRSGSAEATMMVTRMIFTGPTPFDLQECRPATSWRGEQPAGMPIGSPQFCPRVPVYGVIPTPPARLRWRFGRGMSAS